MTTRSLILSPHEVHAALRGELGLVVRPVDHKLAMCFDTPRGPEDVAAGYPMVEDAYGDFHKAVGLCPLGVPGDRLRCKEPHYIQDAHGQHRTDGLRWGPWSGLPTTISSDGKQIVYYKEGFDRSAPCWRSPATMPAWASRITLEVVGVRCVRCGDITEEDAAKTGIERHTIEGQVYFKNYRSGCWTLDSTGSLRTHWSSRYGKRYPWESSWCWCVGVKRVEI